MVPTIVMEGRSNSPIAEGRREASYGLWALALPWTRLELPGWGKVLSLAHTEVRYNDRWRGAGWLEIRCKGHGYRVRLDLSAAFDRTTYFLARYCELGTELVMRHMLRAGDQFVDGGANIGMLSLMAAHLVGATGKVHAFEPNPSVFARLREHMELNGLEAQVTLHDIGLSNVEAKLNLRIVDGGPESGTVARLPDEAVGHVTEVLSVRVAPGDVLLADGLQREPRTLIKLDIEGHEAEAVEGLRNLIDELQPVLITEIIPDRFTASHPCRLFPVLMKRGYRCYEIGLRRGGMLRHELALRPVRKFVDLIEQCDVLWLPPGESYGFERFTGS